MIKESVLGLLDVAAGLYAVLLTIAHESIEMIQAEPWLKLLVWLLVIGYLLFRCIYWYWKAKGKKNQVKHYEERNNHTDKI